MVHPLREHPRTGARACYFAQLKEACSVQRVENRGTLMTEIFEDAAALAKKPLHSSRSRGPTSQRHRSPTAGLGLYVVR
jgi:hypothetical protein